MRKDRTSEWIEFRPRESAGRIWVGGIGLLILLTIIVPTIGNWSDDPRVVSVLLILIAVMLSAPMLVFAWYLPAMRYWIGQDELVLSFGPFMNDRISLSEIKSIRRRRLRITPYVAFRFPGLALFDVAYMGVGTVRMCTTSATRDILLIDTGGRKYGLTPADELAFVDKLVERAGPEVRVSENFNPERRSSNPTL